MTRKGSGSSAGSEWRSRRAAAQPSGPRASTVAGATTSSALTSRSDSSLGIHFLKADTEQCALQCVSDLNTGAATMQKGRGSTKFKPSRHSNSSRRKFGRGHRRGEAAADASHCPLACKRSSPPLDGSRQAPVPAVPQDRRCGRWVMERTSWRAGATAARAASSAVAPATGPRSAAWW